MPPKAVDKRTKLDALAAAMEKTFGKGAAARGGLQKALRSIPTGSLALDFALGTGGWTLGSLIGVYGPRDIGKSSMIGLNAVKNAQAMGLNAAWVALEPFDEKWAAKNGVDIEDLIVVYPTTGEEAFAMTLKLIDYEEGLIDLIVFDSVGAILSEKEIAEDGKPRVGGQAGLITWFVKAAAPKVRNNDVCVIMLNQVRDVIGPVPGMVHQPGGKALEHMQEIIVRLRRGSGKGTAYTIKQAGEDVQIGNQVIAVIERNKKSEGTKKKAVFDYFYMETEDYPFGIDTFGDIINTAKRTGVIKQAGSYFDLPDGERIQGQKGVSEYLRANPDVLDLVREQVLAVMLSNSTGTVLEAVEEEVA